MQTLGIIELVWKGRKIDIQEGGKFKPGGVMNQVVVAGKKVYRAENYEAGEVSVKVPYRRGDTYAGLYTPQEGELQILCDTGQTFVWPDAFQTERPDLTAGKGGEAELKWATGDAEELANG